MTHFGQIRIRFKMFFSQLFRRKNLFLFPEHEFGGHKLGATWSPHQGKVWGHFPIGERAYPRGKPRLRKVLLRSQALKAI